MIEENKKMKGLGYTLSCLGGLILILNFSIWEDSDYSLVLAILAVVLAAAGVLLMAKATQKKKTP